MTPLCFYGYDAFTNILKIIKFCSLWSILFLSYWYLRLTSSPPSSRNINSSSKTWSISFSLGKQKGVMLQTEQGSFLKILKYPLPLGDGYPVLHTHTHNTDTHFSSHPGRGFTVCLYPLLVELRTILSLQAELTHECSCLKNYSLYLTQPTPLNNRWRGQ